MENKTIAGVITLASFISAIAGGMVIPDGTNTYYCSDTDMICIGTHLSDTQKTCYYNLNGTEHYKRCLSEPYWQIYENSMDNEVKIEININIE